MYVPWHNGFVATLPTLAFSQSSDSSEFTSVVRDHFRNFSAQLNIVTTFFMWFSYCSLSFYWQKICDVRWNICLSRRPRCSSYTILLFHTDCSQRQQEYPIVSSPSSLSSMFILQSTNASQTPPAGECLTQKQFFFFTFLNVVMATCPTSLWRELRHNGQQPAVCLAPLPCPSST